MATKLVFILTILLIVLLGWVLLAQTTGVSVTINGKQITGPLGLAIGLWKLILATAILLCVAILLAFVFTGVSLIILGCLALVGLILMAVAFPFLLPLMIPLFLVWAFCAAFRRHKAT